MRPSTGRLLTALAAVPIVWTCSLVAAGAVDVPWADDWALAPTLVKLHDEGLGPGDLWAPHNEHRLVVPRVVMIALALATGWDQRAAMAASLVAAAATLVIVLRQARVTATALSGTLSPWAPLLVASVVFSFAPWQNWLSHWQLQIHLCVLAAAGGLAVLAGPALGRRELALGALLGVAATLSFAAGWAFWPAAGLLLAARQPADRVAPSARLLAWGAGALVLVGLYLPGLTFSPRVPGEGEFSLVNALLGVLALLGSIVSPAATVPPEAPAPPGWPLPPLPVAIALGALGAAGLVWLSVDRLRAAPPEGRRAVLFWPALGAFALAAAVLCGFGRAATWGVSYALQPRYATLAGLLWVAALPLLLVAAPGTSPARARARTGAAAIVGVLAGLGTLFTAPLAVPWAQARATTARRLVEGDPTVLRGLTPVLTEAQAGALVADLRRLELTCFRPRHRAGR